jgi:hypothetical protein
MLGDLADIAGEYAPHPSSFDGHAGRLNTPNHATKDP